MNSSEILFFFSNILDIIKGRRPENDKYLFTDYLRFWRCTRFLQVAISYEVRNDRLHATCAKAKNHETGVVKLPREVIGHFLTSKCFAWRPGQLQFPIYFFDYYVSRKALLGSHTPNHKKIITKTFQAISNCTQVVNIPMKCLINCNEALFWIASRFVICVLVSECFWFVAFKYTVLLFY